MISTSPRPLARRASLVAGALVAGTIAATVPSTPAQAALPTLPLTCNITLSGTPADGIPVVGDVLTSHVTINDATGLLGLNLNALPLTQAVVSVLPTDTATLPGGLTTGTPLDTVTYTVTNADIGKQIVPVGSIGDLSSVPVLGPILTTLSTLYTIPSGIPCTATPTGPVVSPPSNGGSTTLGATPVSSSPRIVGKVKRGKRVTAYLGTVQPGVTVSYQWFKQKKHRAAHAIAGATGATFKIKRALHGKRLSVVVTYSKPGYTPTVLGSASRRVR